MAGRVDDDVILNKVATIERCVARAREHATARIGLIQWPCRCRPADLSQRFGLM